MNALIVPCPTCKAAVGEPCEKRGNIERGGYSHLTRVDRADRKAGRFS